jgi:hypothetical protein
MRPVDLLTLGLRATELALGGVLGGVRLLRRMLEPERGRADEAVSISPMPDVAPETVAEPEIEVVPRPPPPRRRRPVPPPPPEAKTVDEQAEIVAEFAEPGAEEGAGAEVEIGEPWEGYDRMTAAEIERRLSDASVEVLAAVELYEGRRKNRRGVIRAAERRLRART